MPNIIIKKVKDTKAVSWITEKFLEKVVEKPLETILSISLATGITLYSKYIHDIVKWIDSIAPGFQDAFIFYAQTKSPQFLAYFVTPLFLFTFSTVIAITSRRKYAKLYSEYSKHKEIISKIGFRDFYPNKTQEEKSQSLNNLHAQLQAENPNNIRIMAVTGSYTLGDPASPLHKFLETFDGEIRILLIEPYCESFTHRARSLNQNEDNYAEEIQKSVDFCKKLRNSGKSVLLKLYTQRPIWKMIFTEEYLWLQYYNSGSSIDKTPVYCFFSNKDKTSMYYPLTNVFNKRWMHDKNKDVDLSTYKQGSLLSAYRQNP